MKADKNKIPKISIVVPVYNEERYLEEMLTSILNQTLSPAEIICINDASTDESLRIMEQYAQKDDRFIIFSNSSNQGAAICRNTGLKHSSGHYICFLDADDIYVEDMLEREYTTICNYNADMAVVSSIGFKGNIREANFQQGIGGSRWKEQCVSMAIADKNLLGSWNIVPWNKMYKKEFINSYNLSFQNLSSSNDVFFGGMSVFLAEKIAVVASEKPMIFHRIGIETQISSRRVSLNAYLALKKMYDAMVEWGIWTKYFEEYFEFFLGCIFSEYDRCKNEDINRATYYYIATEGLRKIGFLDIDEKKFRNKETFYNLRKCMLYSYDCAWFRRYDKILVWNENKVVLKLRCYDEKHQSIAIWGAAARAESFIKFCQNHNYGIEYVVDRDMSKQGKEICGIEIKSFEDISYLIDVVIVLRSAYFYEIESTVKKINQQIEVFDLEKYLIENFQK